MNSSSLRDKDLTILKLIVENYLKVGKPISSAAIVPRTGISISSATIRNIMAKLEANNLLYQPHTSSGRIPTDNGLRFYVNSLFEEAWIERKHLDYPIKDFRDGKDDFHSIFEQASQVLSDYSDNLGFVISPKNSCLNFRHIRFIKVSEEKVLIILVTLGNMIINEIIETGRYFTQNELDRAGRFVNENFSGKNLLFVRDYLVKEVPKYKLRVEDFLQKITDLLKAYMLTEEKSNQLYLQGTSKLLEKPELFDMRRLRSLFRSFEEKAKLAKLISDFISLDRVKVIIGSELEIPNITDCCLILSHYGDSRQVLGSVGIIGSKRIPYKKIIPLVDHVAKRLSMTISMNQ